MKQFLPFIIFLIMSFVASIAFASENGANNYLIALSPNGQAAMLGKVVGAGCVGRKAFYMGSADDHAAVHSSEFPLLPGHEHDSYWSVKCSDGKSFVVEVFPDGGSKVLECSFIESIHAGHCFKKFPSK
jgi:hypothetical protein